MELNTERLLITVKSYPVLSSKYVELVCTAGLREDGSWVRLYPIPFRTLSQPERYRKYDWIDCVVYKNPKDKRPESFSPQDYHNITVCGHVGTKQKWKERRELILERATVYDDLETLIRYAKLNKATLAVFRPSELVEFECDATEEDWNPDRLNAAKHALQRNDLFDDNSWRNKHELPQKIPYDFFYRFNDRTGKQSKLKILDWEIGMLYLNCLQSAQGDRNIALQKVREKYWDSFNRKDLHFFLGTTLAFQDIGTNPFTIVGVFPIPHKPVDLFDGS